MTEADGAVGSTISLEVDGEVRSIRLEAMVVAGYTGADAAAVEHHIAELADEGVAPPPRVPMYWTMPPSIVTQEPAIDVPTDRTSGEIELALVVDGDDVLVAAGSDHTCRQAETIDIGLSKLICPLPLSTQAWPWAAVADRWHELELAATVEIDGRAEPYQRAAAGANRDPGRLLDEIPWSAGRPRSFALLCGTVPAIGGIRPADRFTGTVTDPRTGRALTVDYRVRPVQSLAL